MLTLAQREKKSSACTNRWLFWLLLAVLYTPAIRIPGGIPIRVDDLLVFGCGAAVAGRYLLRLESPRLDAMFYYSAAVAGTILLSTLTVPDGLGLEVTVKDYLDVLRPVKFLLVYWLVRDANPAASRQIWIRTISQSAYVMLGIVFVEMLFARVAPGSVVVRFFSLFTEKPPELLVDMMAMRPFATFNTPTDLGYVAVLLLFTAPLIRSRRSRNALIAVSFLILLCTATRTMLFSLPLLLLLRATLAGQTMKEKFKRLRTCLATVVLAGVATIVFLPLISPHSADFTQSMIAAVASGDTDEQDSITTRMNNLNLVAYTWQQAPLTGVGSRSLLPDFVDSEIIMTFHRYGVIGMAALLFIYPLGFWMARQVAASDRELSLFAAMALSSTFLIGITQGALINSRTGVLIFVVLGLLRSRQIHELGGKQL